MNLFESIQQEANQMHSLYVHEAEIVQTTRRWAQDLARLSTKRKRYEFNPEREAELYGTAFNIEQDFDDLCEMMSCAPSVEAGREILMVFCNKYAIRSSGKRAVALEKSKQRRLCG